MDQAQLPDVSVDDLMKMIGDNHVTIHRQGVLIRTLLEKVTELEEKASGVSDT